MWIVRNRVGLRWTSRGGVSNLNVRLKDGFYAETSKKPIPP